ncbi:TPA: hypothetical protein ACGO50_001781 [Streptococcus suis]
MMKKEIVLPTIYGFLSAFLVPITICIILLIKKENPWVQVALLTLSSSTSIFIDQALQNEIKNPPFSKILAFIGFGISIAFEFLNNEVRNNELWIAIICLFMLFSLIALGIHNTNKLAEQNSRKKIIQDLEDKNSQLTSDWETCKQELQNNNLQAFAKENGISEEQITELQSILDPAILNSSTVSVNNRKLNI